MSDRDDLTALRRMAELEDKAKQTDAISSVSHPGALNVMDYINKGIYNLGGMATDAASNMGASPEVAGGIGYLSNIGANLLPLEGAASATRAGMGLLSGPLRAGAERLMTSALKPTLQAHQSGDAALAVKTMLDQGINPTTGGVKKMSDKVTALNNDVKGQIANSPAMINKADVYGRLGDVESRFTNQVNPAADLSAIQGVGDQFLSHPQLTGQSQMPVQLAQDLKQGTQRQLADSYGELSGAATEAQKALARGLREEIAKAVPGITIPLGQERDLIRAIQVAERRSYMEQNSNIAGLGALAPGPGGLIGFLADKWGFTKAQVAHLLNPTSGAIPANIGRLSSGAALNQGQLSDQ